MKIATAEPASARSLRKRAKSSTTKLPPKVTSRPDGSQTTMAPAVTSSRIASQSTAAGVRSPPNAPNISSTMAPTASTISGSAGKSAAMSAVSVIGKPSNSSLSADRDKRSLHSAPPRSHVVSRHQRGRRRGAERPVVVVDELRDRGRRNIEHRLREKAEHDGQDGKRTKRDDFAVVEVLDGGEARFVERAEDDLAVEPQRISGRQNRAGRGQCRHPNVDLERADEGEELADEAGRAWQRHVGEREHHESHGVEWHAVD